MTERPELLEATDEMIDDAAPEKIVSSPALGRRDRKRLETRNGLVAVALELFGERGFGAVTVNDIADRADVDPSTFFRHFGSKEAVIFSDFHAAINRLCDAVRAQPADLPLLETMRVAVKNLAATLMVDLENERRRGQLIESTPSVRAQALVTRETLIDQLALAVAERIGVDPVDDSRPYLLAGSFVLASNWYRRYVVKTGDVSSSLDEAVDRIIEIVKGFVAVYASEKGPARPRPDDAR
jgi:AcrR family transcriptional regulator